MSSQPENEPTAPEDETAPDVETASEDEGVAPDLTGVGPREDDQTVSAEDLIELKDDPEPTEPSD